MQPTPQHSPWAGLLYTLLRPEVVQNSWCMSVVIISLSMHVNIECGKQDVTMGAALNLNI